MSTTKTPYAEKLLDPRWQKKRLEILERDKWCCQRCYDDTETLHVHHRIYRRGANPWDYENNCLVTLCATCHEEEKDIMSEALSRISVAIQKSFLGTHAIEIAEGFEKHQITHVTDVCSSALRFFLSDPERSRFLVDVFLKSLSRDNKNDFIEHYLVSREAESNG